MNPEIIKMYEGKKLKEEIQNIRNKVKKLCGQDKVVVKVDRGEEVSAGDFKAINLLIKNNEYYTYRYDDFVMAITFVKFDRSKFQRKEAAK